MIQRKITNRILKFLFKKKVLIIYGARQTGKTTLVKHIIESVSEKSAYLNCDDKEIRVLLEGINSKNTDLLIGNSKLIVIDEAQRVKNIGLILKILIDTNPDIQFIATGSTAFELSNEINEPLTGRKIEFKLLPFSFGELSDNQSVLDEKMQLKRRLIYGSYPDVVNNPGNEDTILDNLANSYLFKDVFSIKDLRKPELLEKLLEALALQIGSETNYSELALTVGANIETVQRYIQLLEQTFVIFRLRSLSRNVRNELKKGRKIYFFDNGIRNALISDYKDIDLRTDKGALWENYFISERYKCLAYEKKTAKQFFWRTTQQQEIDYIEERNNEISAFELKYNPKKKTIFSKTFLKAYNVKEMNIVNTDNYYNFLI